MTGFSKNERLAIEQLSRLINLLPAQNTAVITTLNELRENAERITALTDELIAALEKHQNMTTEMHKARVLAHQQIAALFNCSLEELFAIYQAAEPEADDTSWMHMLYAIGKWRFGDSAWSATHLEFFKQRARERAAQGYITPRTKREMGQKLSLADLGL